MKLYLEGQCHKKSRHLISFEILGSNLNNFFTIPCIHFCIPEKHSQILQQLHND